MSLIETAAAPAESGPMDLGVVPSELDGGVAARAAIGLVVLATDQTLEHEFRILVRQPGVAFYEIRVFNDHDITPDLAIAADPQFRIAHVCDLISLVVTREALTRPGPASLTLSARPQAFSSLAKRVLSQAIGQSEDLPCRLYIRDPSPLQWRHGDRFTSVSHSAPAPCQNWRVQTMDKDAPSRS